MGAQIVRHYVLQNPGKIDRLILSGSMQQPWYLMYTGIFLARIIGKMKGPGYKSRLIEWMSFGSYNKKFKPVRTRFDWMSNDPDMVDKFINDPLCAFDLSVSAYEEFYMSHLEVIKLEKKSMIPHDLPVLIYGGAMDPVNNEGKQLRKLQQVYKKAGVKDLQLKLYPGGRHEMHNDLNRTEVFQDVSGWIIRRI